MASGVGGQPVIRTSTRSTPSTAPESSLGDPSTPRPHAQSPSATTSRGSGIISMAVVGGAIVPVLINWIVGQSSYMIALIIPVIGYLYIAWYGVSGSKHAQTAS